MRVCACYENAPVRLLPPRSSSSSLSSFARASGISPVVVKQTSAAAKHDRREKGRTQSAKRYKLAGNHTRRHRTKTHRFRAVSTRNRVQNKTTLTFGRRSTKGKSEQAGGGRGKALLDARLHQPRLWAADCAHIRGGRQYSVDRRNEAPRLTAEAVGA